MQKSVPFMNYNKTSQSHFDSLDILHHVGVINRDLQNLSERYEKLGFLLTPVSTPQIVIEAGEPPTSLGVGNRHAIFRNNYLELLGIIDAHRWKNIPKEKLGPYNIDIPLARYDGLHVMHFGTEHIELVKERFQKEKIPLFGDKKFPKKCSDGKRRTNDECTNNLFSS
jgi:hypothetical protein